jgi:hypothetical protein
MSRMLRKTMRTSWLLPLVFIMMCDAAPRASRIPPASDVVTYGKAIDVAVLDAALRPQKLQDWIASPSLHLQRVQWSLGDCDLQPNDAHPEANYPICTRIDFRRGTAWGWISVKVGRVHEGIHGRPELLTCVVKSGGFPPAGVFRSTKRLSELPALLEAATEKR